MDDNTVWQEEIIYAGNVDRIGLNNYPDLYDILQIIRYVYDGANIKQYYNVCY